MNVNHTSRTATHPTTTPLAVCTTDSKKTTKQITINNLNNRIKHFVVNFAFPAFPITPLLIRVIRILTGNTYLKDLDQQLHERLPLTIATISALALTIIVAPAVSGAHGIVLASIGSIAGVYNGFTALTVLAAQYRIEGPTNSITKKRTEGLSPAKIVELEDTNLGLEPPSEDEIQNQIPPPESEVEMDPLPQGSELSEQDDSNKELSGDKKLDQGSNLNENGNNESINQNAHEMYQKVKDYGSLGCAIAGEFYNELKTFVSSKLNSSRTEAHKESSDVCEQSKTERKLDTEKKEDATANDQQLALIPSGTQGTAPKKSMNEFLSSGLQTGLIAGAVFESVRSGGYFPLMMPATLSLAYNELLPPSEPLPVSTSTGWISNKNKARAMFLGTMAATYWDSRLGFAVTLLQSPHVQDFIKGHTITPLNEHFITPVGTKMGNGLQSVQKRITTEWTATKETSLVLRDNSKKYVLTHSAASGQSALALGTTVITLATMYFDDSGYLQFLPSIAHAGHLALTEYWREKDVEEKSDALISSANEERALTLALSAAPLHPIAVGVTGVYAARGILQQVILEPIITTGKAWVITPLKNAGSTALSWFYPSSIASVAKKAFSYSKEALSYLDT